MATLEHKISVPTRSRFPVWLKRVLLVLGALIVVAIVQTLPVFIVKPFGAKEYRSADAVVFYSPGDEAGAKEVFELVNGNIGRLKAAMQSEWSQPLEIYVYPKQSSLVIREAGFIFVPFAPKWFIGDSEAGVIKMVSPNTPVPGHTHDTILNGTLHEVVHSINYYKNPKLSYFWDNGLATYLANQVPEEAPTYAAMPSIDDMHTDNGIKFGNMGGYQYSYNYIEFLDRTYGWDKILEYAAGSKNYEAVFGKSEEAIYHEWGRYLKDPEA